MPAMIRSHRKATRIAWSLLGVPSNIRHDTSAFSKDVQRKLSAHRTNRGPVAK